MAEAPDLKDHILSTKRHFHPLWSSNFSSPSHTLAPTYEAGDYYIGDIYEPSRIGQSGELLDKHLVSFKPPAP